MEYVEWKGSRISARIGYETQADTAQNRTQLQIRRVEVYSHWGESGSCWITGRIRVNETEAAVLSLTNAGGCGVLLGSGWAGGGEDWSGWSDTPIQILHGADGRAEPVTIAGTISVQTTRGDSWGSVSGAVAVELPTIPRAAAVQAAGTELGKPVQIWVDSPGAGVETRLEWRCGSRSGTLTGTSWTPPLELAAQAPNTDFVEITITAVALYAGVEIGRSSAAVRCAIPETVVPTLEVTLEDGKGYAERFGGYVRGCSQLRVRTRAEGAYGASIVRIAVRCGSLAAQGADAVLSLPDAGRVAVHTAVTDSRGRTADWWGAVTVLDYTPPTVTAEAIFRCTQDGTPDGEGSWGCLRFRAETAPLPGNTPVLGLRWRKRGTESWNRAALPGDGTQGIFPAAAEDDWECRVALTDSFHTVHSETVQLGAAFVLLELSRSRHSLGIGRGAGEAQTLSIGLDTRMYGHRLRDLGMPQSDTDAVSRAWAAQLYPVGAVYLSTVEQCAPAQLLGGTWERLTGVTLGSTGVYAWRRKS